MTDQVPDARTLTALAEMHQAAMRKAIEETSVEEYVRILRGDKVLAIADVAHEVAYLIESQAQQLEAVREWAEANTRPGAQTMERTEVYSAAKRILAILAGPSPE